MHATAFLTLLFGAIETRPDAQVVFFSRQTQQSKWVDPEQLTKETARLTLLSATQDLYVGVALQDHVAAIAQAGASTRGLETTARGIPGVWVEIDIKGPSHAISALPPTMEDALAVLESLPFPASVIVNSGHGLHALWLFREFWWFDDPAEHLRASALVEGWQALLRSHMISWRWMLDPTATLTHMLRMPGLQNHKIAPSVPTSLLRHTESARYNPSDFAPYSAEIKPRSSFRERTTRPDAPPAASARIAAQCSWMRHCRDDAPTLGEPEWYGMLSILAYCEDGETAAHEWSRPYRRYSATETDLKLQQAREKAGPRTCQFVHDTFQSVLCGVCPFWGKITSPIVLGREGEGERIQHAPEVEAFTVNPKASPDAELFDGLREIDDKFKRTWEHRRKDFKNTELEVYEYSLARQATQADWPVQEVINLLVYHRRKGAAPAKDAPYYQKILQKITMDRTMPEEEILANEEAQATAAQGPAAVLAFLREKLGIPFTAVIKRGEENARYGFRLDDGREIEIGSANVLINSPRQVRAKLFEISNVVMRSQKDDEWRRLVQMFHAVQVYVPIADSSRVTQILEWIRAYLDTATPSEFPRALTDNAPVIEEGIVYIHQGSLRRYIITKWMERVTSQDVRSWLSEAGFAASPKTGRIAGKNLCRTYWHAPVEALAQEE